MIKVWDSVASDVYFLHDHGRQEQYRELVMASDGLLECVEGGLARTVWNEDTQKIVGIGGVLPIHNSRGVAWAVLPTARTQDFIHVHRTALQIFKDVDLKRIEAHVDPEFPEAVRWVQMLGFKCECERMTSFLPDGKAASLYALLR